MLKTDVKEWEADFDEVYSGKDIEITPFENVDLSSAEHEQRFVRGTKVMFIGDYAKVLEMQDDISVYRDLYNRAMIKINNPDYMEFDVYTKRILKDPLKNIFEMQSVTSDLAKKYMDYAVLYDKDKKHSDKLILKHYFVTTDAGVLILTEDFVDYNIDLDVDIETGVLGIKIKQSENTSKYTEMYKDI